MSAVDVARRAGATDVEDFGVRAGDGIKSNILHGQGIRDLAPGLVVEATAPDGLVEAVRLDSPTQFLLAVQWHPEWKVLENDFYTAIFKSFAAAMGTYRSRKAK